MFEKKNNFKPFLLYSFIDCMHRSIYFLEYDRKCWSQALLTLEALLVGQDKNDY